MTVCDPPIFTFFDNQGKKLTLGNSDIISATWGRSLNDVGRAIVTIPTECGGYGFDTYSQEDLGLLIEYNGKTELSTFWFLRRFKEVVQDKATVFRLIFKDANHLLDRRIVAYKADEPEGSEPRTRINEAANVALKRIFDTNYLVGASAGRDISQFVSSVGVSGVAPVVSKEIAWHNILSAMRQIVRTSRDKGTELFFDVTAQPTAFDVQLVFKTFVGQRGADKTGDSPIFTDHPLFNLKSFEIDYDVPNVGYAGGAGKGRDRVTAVRENTRANLGRYTRFEAFKSIQSSDPDTVGDEAAELVNNSAGVVRLEGQLLGDLALDYDFGDRVIVTHRDLTVESEVATITANWENQELDRRVIVKSVGGG